MRTINFIISLFFTTLLFAKDPTIASVYTILSSECNNEKRIEIASALFLGKPYFLGALGEGRHARYDQQPLYRFDAFDCETFVDTVLALTLAKKSSDFSFYMQRIRYKKGVPTFIYRNHFTCLDWNKNNQEQGFLKDITTSIHDKQGHSVAQYAHAWIDKPNWYSHFSIDKIHIKHASHTTQVKRLKELQDKGKKLEKRISHIAYLPLSILFDSNQKPNAYLFNQIPNAAVIEIIRPNWDLEKQIGTRLNVSHLGFAIWKDGRLFFRNSSSTAGKVVDNPMIEYLQQALNSPTIKGINVQILIEETTV